LDWWPAFQKNVFLVDDIYPEMARFVKMVSVPTRHVQKNSAWQKATWKNIKCTFGVLHWKFQILSHPFEKWDEKHVNQTVICCILLYNMMVQEFLWHV